MKPPPCLRLEPRPSRIGGVAVASGCASIAMLMLALPLDPWATIAALLAAGGVAMHGLWRCVGGGVPARIHVGHDRRLTVTGRDGRSRDGTVRDDSYVGARLTTIVWRPDDSPRYLPARTMLILPDTLPDDDFRRLRVLLRYGRPAADPAASGVDEG